MTPPARVVAAVTAASLAGAASPELWAALPPNDRALAEALHARLRTGRSREEAARAVLAARAALDRPGDSVDDAHPGALAYARWLRGLDAVERPRIARALDASTAEAVRAASPNATPFDAALAGAAGHAIALGAKTLSRLPTARELAALLALARGAADVREAPIIRWERSIRVAGRQAPLIALAEAVA
ncbi:MAG: hypothetical protein U0324_04695 [Polyangiales bacterium]